MITVTNNVGEIRAHCENSSTAGIFVSLAFYLLLIANEVRIGGWLLPCESRPNTIIAIL